MIRSVRLDGQEVPRRGRVGYRGLLLPTGRRVAVGLTSDMFVVVGNHGWVLLPLSEPWDLEEDPEGCIGVHVAGDQDLALTIEVFNGLDVVIEQVSLAQKLARRGILRSMPPHVGENEWNFICQCALAVHARDAARLNAVARGWNDAEIVGRRYYYYLDFALRWAIVRRLAGETSLQRIARLADELWPDFSKVVTLSHETLANQLLTVVNLAEPDSEVTDRRTSPASVAALGLLLDDPDKDLQALEVALAGYLEATRADIEPHGMWVCR